MKLSIVTTLYRSRAHLAEFHRRCVEAAALVTKDVELIYVNDGSPDDSLDVALGLRAAHANVTVIDLSRNFGHHRAVMAGLQAARGERVFLIDCDLEESPALLAEFWKLLDAEPDLDVAFGVQARRKGGPFERLSGWIFWRLFNALSGLELVPNLLTVRLMSRRYVEALTSYPETELFLAGLAHLAGFRQRPVVVDKSSRGTSSYTLRKRLQLLLVGVTSFSSAPLVLMFYAGTWMAGLSVVMTVLLVLRKAMYGDVTLMGWTSVMVSIWFLAGVLLMALGVLGLYVSQVFLEVKRRPRVIVRAVHGSRHDAS